MDNATDSVTDEHCGCCPLGKWLAIVCIEHPKKTLAGCCTIGAGGGGALAYWAAEAGILSASSPVAVIIGVGVGLILALMFYTHCGVNPGINSWATKRYEDLVHNQKIADKR